ncbi:MAG: hypothetical protein IH614_07120 [Desulfuromonadales bacterium]|nr:hypothetical protein [Desulfuromonadales bacterium]
MAAFLGLTGCSRQAAGGAAVGAVGAAGIYEYQAHRAMEELEKDYKDGKITREEYERRRDEISRRSIIK